MKRLTILCMCLLFSLSSFTQINQSAKKWQEDLRFLQKTVHKEYPFLFKKTTAKEFDQKVEELYTQIPKLEEHQIVAGFSRIVASFQYGHTFVNPTRSKFKLHILPVNFYQFSDGVYLQAVRPKDKKALGAKVLAIEGMPIEKAIEAIKPVVPVENEQYFKAYGLRFLGFPELLHAQGISKTLKNEITLSLEKEGNTFDHTLTAEKMGHLPTRYGFIPTQDDWLDVRNQENTPLYLSQLDKIFTMEYLPEHKSLYVRQSQVQDEKEESIAEFYTRVFEFVDQNDVDRLIIDVRLNGGGNNYKNKPVITGLIQSEKINRPGHLFVITGRRTYSACQNLVNEIDNYTNAIFVGEPTSENINFYGDNREVKLPNSQINVYLSFAWWQDKPQWENADWLAPDIPVEMSFEQYRTNQDPALEAALNMDNINYIGDPMAYLKELYIKGQFDQLKVEATKFVEDPRYGAVNFEQEFNNTGYRFLNQGMAEEAIFVFQLNTSLFPESANAWDSLGESHLVTKQIDKAKKYYNKAISLDPDGRIGDNARNMLKKIEAGDY